MPHIEPTQFESERYNAIGLQVQSSTGHIYQGFQVDSDGRAPCFLFAVLSLLTTVTACPGSPSYSDRQLVGILTEMMRDFAVSSDRESLLSERLKALFPKPAESEAVAPKPQLPVSKRLLAGVPNKWLALAVGVGLLALLFYGLKGSK